jgi:hypothetical protein
LLPSLELSILSGGQTNPEGQLVDSLPPELISFLQALRPLFRAEVFVSFGYLMAGILIGEAKYGTVRASVFAGADYWPQRLSDLFCRHKVSHQAFMAKLTALALQYLYLDGLPARLFWIADATHAEKPYARQIASVGLFHRTKRVVGQARHLQGHCYVFAAHLYHYATTQGQRWASVLVGALLYVKGRSIPTLVAVLANHLRLPAGVRHVWLGDRGILSRPLWRGLAKLGHFTLGRVRRNQVVYFPPPVAAASSPTRRGRPRLYGAGCRVDQLRRRYAHRLRQHTLTLRLRGRERFVRVWETDVLLRGVWPGRALPARVLIVTVPGLHLKPWYLVTTDLELAPVEAVRAYDGRYQIEVNFDEVKELGLGHYQGRSGQGVRRWPLFLCVAQLLLKLIATGALTVKLPTLDWPWYDREDTVGQVRRRLTDLCQPRISRPKGSEAKVEKFPVAA